VSQYLLRRMLVSLLVLFTVSAGSFVLMHLAPGDPVYVYVNPEKRNMSPESLDALRHQLGLDRPILVQYLIWLRNTLEGNWGYSVKSRAPVLREIASRLPNTLLLSFASLILAVIVAIPIGTLSAVKQYSIVDYLSTIGAFVGISVPSFWFALILIWLFSVKLGWLPSTGMRTLTVELTGGAAMLDVIRHLVLPVVVLSLAQMSEWTRYVRTALLEVLGQDYIRTARAKGVPESMVTIKHALRNALIPVITIAGLSLPALVSGAYVVETIFGWPGMGRLGVNAIMARDYPVIMGVTMMSCVVVIAGNLLADLAYVVADPRIHYA